MIAGFAADETACSIPEVEAYLPLVIQVVHLPDPVTVTTREQLKFEVGQNVVLENFQNKLRASGEGVNLCLVDLVPMLSDTCDSVKVMTAGVCDPVWTLDVYGGSTCTEPAARSNDVQPRRILPIEEAYSAPTGAVPVRSELVNDVSLSRPAQQVFSDRCSVYTSHICIEGLAEVWQFQLIGSPASSLSLVPESDPISAAERRVEATPEQTLGAQSLVVLGSKSLTAADIRIDVLGINMERDPINLRSVKVGNTFVTLRRGCYTLTAVFSEPATAGGELRAIQQHVRARRYTAIQMDAGTRISHSGTALRAPQDGAAELAPLAGLGIIFRTAGCRTPTCADVSLITAVTAVLPTGELATTAGNGLYIAGAASCEELMAGSSLPDALQTGLLSAMSDDVRTERRGAAEARASVHTTGVPLTALLQTSTHGQLQTLHGETSAGRACAVYIPEGLEASKVVVPLILGATHLAAPYAQASTLRVVDTMYGVAMPALCFVQVMDPVTLADQCSPYAPYPPPAPPPRPPPSPPPGVMLSLRSVSCACRAGKM